MGPSTSMEEMLKVTYLVFYNGSRGERFLEKGKCKKKEKECPASCHPTRPITPQKEKPKSAPLANAKNAGQPDTRKDVP